MSSLWNFVGGAANALLEKKKMEAAAKLEEERQKRMALLNFKLEEKRAANRRAEDAIQRVPDYDRKVIVEIRGDGSQKEIPMPEAMQMKGLRDRVMEDRDVLLKDYERERQIARDAAADKRADKDDARADESLKLQKEYYTRRGQEDDGYGLDLNQMTNNLKQMISQLEEVSVQPMPGQGLTVDPKTGQPGGVNIDKVRYTVNQRDDARIARLRATLAEITSLYKNDREAAWAAYAAALSGTNSAAVGPQTGGLGPSGYGHEK